MKDILVLSMANEASLTAVGVRMNYTGQDPIPKYYLFIPHLNCKVKVVNYSHIKSPLAIFPSQEKSDVASLGTKLSHVLST